MTIDSSWCTLKVDNTNMFALMCLHAHNGEEEHNITEQLVMDFLSELDIVYGINSIAIQSMLEHAMYDQYICIARGIPATRGEDGHYDFQKETEDMKKKPLINEDGTADYKNSLNLATINEGELLAVYIPPTKGKEGMDVYGNTVPPLGDGKDILPLRGRGIISDDDKINYYAEYTGHIVNDNGRLSIEKLYRVNGELNIEVGNIRFDGDVEIMGDVRSGLEIDAKGSIFIHGHVGACKLTAGVNIIVDKGIQGRGTCEISAGEDVVCKFVESCRITALHNIYADSVLNSSLIANNQVIITSKHGNVLSSEIYGMCGVTVKEAGNSAGTPTLLRAGLPREFYARTVELTQMIAEIDGKVEAFNHHLENLDKLAEEAKNIADPKQKSETEAKLSETRMQIIRARIVLTSNKNEYTEELTGLNEKIAADAANSIINVTGTVYDGVRIYIGTYPYIVTEAVKEVCFKLCAGEVIACPFE